MNEKISLSSLLKFWREVSTLAHTYRVHVKCVHMNLSVKTYRLRSNRAGCLSVVDFLRENLLPLVIHFIHTQTDEEVFFIFVSHHKSLRFLRWLSFWWNEKICVLSRPQRSEMDSKNQKIKRPKRQQKVIEDYWDCSVCTFRNTAEAFKCLMCGVRKGRKKILHKFRKISLVGSLNMQALTTWSMKIEIPSNHRSRKSPKLDDENIFATSTAADSVKNSLHVFVSAMMRKINIFVVHVRKHKHEQTQTLPMWNRGW